MGKDNSILIIDDESANISGLTAILSPEYTVYASSDGQEAIETAEEFLPDVILLDVLMPGMDGYEVIAALKSSKKTRDIPVIFITGLDTAGAEEKGLALGAADYITKPFNSAIVKLRVKNQADLVNHVRALNERTTTLQQRTEKLVRLQNSMASVLANIVENRDKLTGKHVENTAAYLRILLNAMLERGLFAGEIKNWNIDVVVSSSRLHDIGKIAVSDLLLNKPGRLTAEEYETMKIHALEGETIIDNIITKSGDEDFLYSAKLFAGSHHERWDGRGYPRGLKGTDIPLHGRIMALADIYDALVSDRPYKKAFTHERAVEIILEAKGRQLDPQIVDLFLEVSDLFPGAEPQAE